MRKKRKPKSPRALLKAKVWKACSEYVRKRDCDKNGFGKCITCDTSGHWKEFHAGHFISGRTNGILFDTRGIRLQCPGCNLYGNGKPIEYLIALEKEMGVTKARNLRDQLMKKKNTVTTLSMDDLEKLLRKFTK